MEKRSCSDSEAGSSLPSKKVYSIAELLKIIREISLLKREPPLDFDVIDSCSKRERAGAGFVHANCSSSEGNLVFHRNVTRPSDFDDYGSSKSVRFEKESTEKESTEKKQGKPIDCCKKLQCCVILRRMMVNPDGKDFHNFVHSKTSTLLVPEIECEKPTDLMDLKSKLDKGLYIGTEEFAADFRLMLSHVMLYINNPIYKVAKRLLDEFESRWKSLNQNWAAEKFKEGEDSRKRADHSQNSLTKPSDSETSRKRENSVEKVKEREDFDRRGDYRKFNSKPSADFRKCTMVANVAGSVNHFPEQVHEEKKKTKRGDPSDVTKCTCTTEPTEHFLDSIMKSQENLLDFGRKDDLLRMQQREAARVALEKMEREVFIDDNLRAFEELELLCGHSLTSSTTDHHTLESLGLFLKDEAMSHCDEDLFLQGDWEEGEIVS